MTLLLYKYGHDPQGCQWAATVDDAEAGTGIARGRESLPPGGCDRGRAITIAPVHTRISEAASGLQQWRRGGHHWGEAGTGIARGRASLPPGGCDSGRAIIAPVHTRISSTSAPASSAAGEREVFLCLVTL